MQFNTHVNWFRADSRLAPCHRETSLQSNAVSYWLSANIISPAVVCWSKICSYRALCTLQWRHNELAGVSIHQPHDCLLNRLFTRRSKKTSKLRVTGLCAGNSPVTGEFPAQRASNTENVSIWWRHHEYRVILDCETSIKYAVSTLASPIVLHIDFCPQTSCNVIQHIRFKS